MTDIGRFYYGINPTDGNLYQVPRSFINVPVTPTLVGTGWAGMKHVFSPGEQVVYSITAEGYLLWWKHEGQLTFTPNWGDGNKNVADGWANHRLVCAAGNGVIFAVHENGDFYRYRHTGWQTGAKTWENWAPLPLANGWNHIKKIVGINGENLFATATDGNLYFYRITADGIQVGPVKVGEVGWDGFTDLIMDDVSGEANIAAIFAITPQRIYSFNVNADGTLGNRMQFPNGAPSLTRWLACPTTITIVENHPYLTAGNYYLRSEQGVGNNWLEPAYAYGPLAGEVLVNGDFLPCETDRYRQFEVIPLSAPGPNMSIAIRAPNGKYVCSELDGIATCNRTQRSTWETFTLENMPQDGAPWHAEAWRHPYRIKDYQGRYMQTTWVYLPWRYVRVEFVIPANVDPGRVMQFVT